MVSVKHVFLFVTHVCILLFLLSCILYVCILYTILWANLADGKLIIFFVIFPENRQIDIPCRLSPGERKLLFSRKNKKKYEFDILLNWPIAW